MLALGGTTPLACGCYPIGCEGMSVCLFLEVRATPRISTVTIYRLTESMGVPLLGLQN